MADSKYHLTTTEYTIASARLPESFQGYRIVQLSDLHAAEFGKNNKRLIAAVETASPDLIALTGDFIETEEDISITQSLIQSLTEIAPVYYVSGNHDWASGAMKQLRNAVTESGGSYLSNEAVVLSRGKDTILLAGAEDPNGPSDMPTPDEFMAQLHSKYPDSCCILLAHRNSYLTQYPTLPCDLILTGHGHGGIIRLPVVGGLLGTELNLFPQYDAGAFQGDSYTMVVSRGLGGRMPIPRLFNRPEIVCITLKNS